MEYVNDKTVMKPLLIFIGLLTLMTIMVLLISYYVNKEKPYTFDSEEQEELFRNMPDVPAIEFNGVTLFDSTNYNPTDNVCVGERYGMEITIENCFAQDIDGRDITHDVSFRWNGDIKRNISWIFVYEHELESGSMSLLSNVSRQATQLRNTWVSNYLIDKIVSYTAIPQPSYCDLGNLNNTQFYNVTRTNTNSTTYNQTICFTEVTPVNATSFLISGNADLPTQVTIWEKKYVDITDRIDFLGVGLLNDERSYYQTVDVPFEVGQEYKTKWVYTPVNKTRAGKWHILGYDSETGLIQSVLNDEYIYVDPWWNNDWTRKQEINITGSNTNLYNYQIKLVINKTANMNADFSDIRFTNSSDNSALSYWIENYTSTNATIWVKFDLIPASVNTTFYMYYGNPTATTSSNGYNTFIQFGDFRQDGGTLPQNWTSGSHMSYTLDTINGINITTSTTAGWERGHGIFWDGVLTNQIPARFIINGIYRNGAVHSAAGLVTGATSSNTVGGFGVIPTVQSVNNFMLTNVSSSAVGTGPTGGTSASLTKYNAVLYINSTSIMRFEVEGQGTVINSVTNRVISPYGITTGNYFNNALYGIRYLFITNWTTGIQPTYILGAEEIGGDQNMPLFTPASPSPANNTAYVSGATYTFQTTITSTNGTAGLSFNGTNYSMTNSSATFTRQLTDLGGGTYTYYFWAYGNGTANRYNQSQTYSYTIARATSEINTYIEGDRSNKNSINSTNLNLSTRLITGVGPINLYYGNTLINSGTGWLSNITLVTTGNYTIIGNYSGNANYTSASESWNLTVLAGNAISVTTVSTSPPTPITYGTNSTWSCVNDYSLPTEMWVNGVNRTSEKGVSLLRGAGSYSINCSSTTNVEYNITGSSQVSVYVINKATPTVEVSASPSETENYLTETTVTGSGCPTQVTCTLTRAGTTVSNPDVQTLNAGTYLYNYSVPTNENYTSTSDTLTLTINKINPSMSLAFSPSQSVVNGTETTVTGSGCPDASCVLRRNGVIVTNPETTTLAVGSYAYNYSFAGSTNYNAFSAYGVLSVNPVTFAGTNGTMNFTSTNLTNTLNFQVPYRFVTQAYMNLSSNAINTLCYQESANTSNQVGTDGACNLNYNGNYQFEGSWDYPNNTIDGDWGTYARTGAFSGNGNITINYTKPSINISNVIWRIKNDNDGNELLLPIISTCYSYLTDKISLKIVSIGGEIGIINWQCLNASGYQTLYTKEAVPVKSQVYEEGIYWNVTLAPANLNITINNNQIYYYAGLFNQSNNRTNNFYNTLNSYLSTCSYTDNYCVVPITFSSTTPGPLNYSDVLFSNEGFIENSQVYNLTTTETSRENFKLNLAYDSSAYTLSARLNYNNTFYTATTTTSNYNATASANVNIPLVTSQTNATFYWTIGLTNSSGTYYYNSTSNQQTINNFTLFYCPPGVAGTRTLNFTFYNETNLAKLNQSSFEATFDYYLGTGSIYKTLSVSNLSTAEVGICYTNSTTVNIKTNAEIKYGKTNYVTRDYYLTDYSLSNTMESIFLYLLGDGDATSFIIKVQDQALQAVANAYVYIQRYYPGTNSYKTVQVAITDSNGETIGAYQTETVDYKHIIIKDGVTLLETDKQKIFGKTVPFTLIFIVGEKLAIPWEVFTNENVTSTLVYNKTSSIVTYSYTSDYSVTANLVVIKEFAGNISDTLICNSSDSGTIGILTCSVGNETGSYVAIAYIDGNQDKVIRFTIRDAIDVFGEGGLFIGMFIIMIAGFAFIWNPSAGIIGINVALIFVNLTGLITISPVFIFGSITISIVLLWLFKT
jgi:hypothetical protein